MNVTATKAVSICGLTHCSLKRLLCMAYDVSGLWHVPWLWLAADAGWMAAA